jgi:hypothetical protein
MYFCRGRVLRSGSEMSTRFRRHRIGATQQSTRVNCFYHFRKLRRLLSKTGHNGNTQQSGCCDKEQSFTG